jgi:hypothetical protein
LRGTLEERRCVRFGFEDGGRSLVQHNHSCATREHDENEDVEEHVNRQSNLAEWSSMLLRLVKKL